MIHERNLLSRKQELTDLLGKEHGSRTNLKTKFWRACFKLQNCPNMKTFIITVTDLYIPQFALLMPTYLTLLQIQLLPELCCVWLLWQPFLPGKIKWLCHNSHFLVDSWVYSILMWLPFKPKSHSCSYSWYNFVRS